MQSRCFRQALVSLSMMVSVAACSSRPAEPQIGMYRAVLALPGGEAPVGLEIAKEQGRHVLYLVNGSERTRVSNVNVTNGQLTAVFPGYENSLRATLRGDTLAGI